MNLKERVLQYLQERRDKIIEGGVNCIPSPFKRFSNSYIGIEQGRYYIVSASTKVGKTQLASFLYLYSPLIYAYSHPDQVRLKIFYYPLEETPQNILQRFLSYLLFRLSGKNIRISPQDLRSSKQAVEQEIIDKLGDAEYANLLDFFEQTVTFSSSRNPTGIYQEVRKYMEDNGSIHKKKAIIKDDFGIIKEVDAFDYYEPNDPDEYVLVIVDHLSLVQPERGMNLKQAADKLSEYFVILRNRYKVSPVLVQQQAFAGEDNESMKLKRIRPSAYNLSDSKYPSRDCNLMLGLFSPFRFELPEYRKYDIKKFKDHIRFLEVVINRDGNSGDIIPLYFDGATCYFEELPKADDTPALNKWYIYIENLNKSITKKLFFLKKLLNLNFKN